MFPSTGIAAPDVESILVLRWFTVYDAGPTLNQYLFNVLCLLEWFGATMPVDVTISDQKH